MVLSARFISVRCLVFSVVLTVAIILTRMLQLTSEYQYSADITTRTMKLTNMTRIPTLESALVRLLRGVVLLGQFNYGGDPSDVLIWATHWRQVFKRVVACGPFTPEAARQLAVLGVEVQQGEADAGWVSPTLNLARALERFKDVPGVNGVFFLHDDALLDLTQLLRVGEGGVGFKSNQIAGGIFRDLERLSAPGGKLENRTGWWWDKSVGVEAINKAMADPRSLEWATPSKGENVSKYVLWRLGPMASDFAYVPLARADEFERLAVWLTDARVFLEIALPTALSLLRRRGQRPGKAGLQSPYKKISTCTTNEYTCRRSCPGLMLEAEPCEETEVIHPIKIHNNAQDWACYFDAIVFPGLGSHEWRRCVRRWTGKPWCAWCNIFHRFYE